MSHNTFPTNTPNIDPFSTPSAAEAQSFTPEQSEKKASIMSRLRKKLARNATSEVVTLQQPEQGNPFDRPTETPQQPQTAQYDPFQSRNSGAETARESIIANTNTQVGRLSAELDGATIANNEQVKSGEVTGYQMQNEINSRVDAAQTLGDYKLNRFNQSGAELAAKDAGEMNPTNPENIDPFNVDRNRYVAPQSNPFDREN